ncbi:GAF domain-containing protein [Thermodesulfobacteriota bacterium]
MNTKSYRKHDIPNDYIDKWQKTVDFMAKIYEVPAGLIMRVWPEKIEVLVSSYSEGNPYRPGENEKLMGKLYCETVMETGAELNVPNALEDKHWKDNPDVKLNMIMYLGIPLIWSNDEIFGTICVLDKKTRIFSQVYHDLLWELKKIIENDFKLITVNHELKSFNNKLVDREMRIIEMKEEVNRLSEELGREPTYPPIWCDVTKPKKNGEN